jgi:hypothetical protein
MGIKSERRSVLARVLLSVVIFFAIELLVFHTNFYPYISDPDSMAGAMYSILWNEDHRVMSDHKQVLGIGDSRMCLRCKLANELTGETGYEFANIAVAGTTPRCWYYMLNHEDPTARKYSAILIQIDDYDDEDWEDLASRTLDIYYLLPILPLSDVFQFSWSFPHWGDRWEAFRGSLLRGWSYKRDFMDYLVHHRKRWFEVKWARDNLAYAFYNYKWPENSLKGMTVDWQARKIHFPDGVPAVNREATEATLLRGVAEQTGQRAAYRRKWFGRIVQYYKGSGTRLICFRFPRGPMLRPYPVVKKSSSIREFAARGEITLLDEHLFDDLERPEYFVDGLHMNGPGAAIFTYRLAREVGRILGRPSAAKR